MDVDDCCNWKGTNATIKAHLAICKFGFIPCPRQCEDLDETIHMVMRRRVTKHLEKHCLLRDYKCKSCGKTGTYSYITRVHLEPCLVRIIPCPSIGCSQKMLHMHIPGHLGVCVHALVPCKFRNLGCMVMMKRKVISKHEDKNNKFHFRMIQEALARIMGSNSNLNDINDQLEGKFAEMARGLHVLGGQVEQMEGDGKDWEEQGKRNNKWITLMEEEITLIAQGILDNTFCFRMTDCQRKQEAGSTFTSQPFYTRSGSCGYHMVIEVSHIRIKNRGNAEDAASDYISIFARIVDGKFNDELPWPFIGDITFILLNQIIDRHHFKVLHIKAEDNVIRGVTCGIPQFVSQKVCYDADAMETGQYLMDDTLCFKIAVKEHKTWLTCSN